MVSEDCVVVNTTSEVVLIFSKEVNASDVVSGKKDSVVVNKISEVVLIGSKEVKA